MRRTVAVLAISLLGLSALHAAAAPPQISTEPPPADRSARGDTLFLFAAEGPGSFGSPGTDSRGFTFDGPDGEAEKAGWFGVDLRAQEIHWQLAPTTLCAGTGTDMSEAAPFDTTDTVNDFALWCGSQGNCDWANPDGYGNYWEQFVMIELDPLAVDKDVTVSFAYRSDFEGSDYDYLSLRSYLGDGGHVHWSDRTGGDRTYREAEVVVPAVWLDLERPRLAFRFKSDGAWSDQDGDFPSDLGAVWLDNIRVEQAGRELLAADFETGQLPAELHFEAEESAGDYAKLYQGLFQGDSDPVNDSFVWAFFDSSTSSWEDPEYEFGIFRGPPYVKNVIESPRLSVDSSGAPLALGPGTRVLLGFDVYLDLDISDLIFHAWYIGGVMVDSGNCNPQFENDNTVYYDESRAWVSFVRDVTEELRESAGGVPWNAESIVARLAVLDMYDIWGFGHSEHRNQAPNFDNIRVMLVEGDLTDVPPTPVGLSLSASPNPFNPSVELRLVLPGAGRCKVTLHDLSGRRVAALLDEKLPAGERRLRWDGKDEAGAPLPSGVYFARASVPGSETSIKLVLLK